MRKSYSATVSVLLAVGFLMTDNTHGENNCAEIERNLKNKINQTLEKIKS